MGFSTDDNLEALRHGHSGISLIEDKSLHHDSFYAAKIDSDALSKTLISFSNPGDFTKLEQMMLLAMIPIIDKHCSEISDKTALIISTTKGNIDVLKGHSKLKGERAYLWKLGAVLADYFQLKSKPIIVSNACISGGLAVLTGKRLIEASFYDNAIVVAGDVLSEFTVSGFFSFNAISSKPCKPFSKTRDGITIGEAAACVFVNKKESDVEVLSGATANDANHISGPSRTGEGLYISIENSLRAANLNAEAIDYISPHGTATVYNDAMEIKAFSRADLKNSHLNPIKGYYGHTLGASALIETIISKRVLQHQEFYPSLGCSDWDETDAFKIPLVHQKEKLTYALNTASGFGGCNLAMIMKKTL